MIRCALLTTDDLSGYVVEDELAVEPLRRHGFEVSWVPWRSGASWADYDVVVVRTTWDYHLDPSAFLDTIADIEASGTPLWNPPDAIRWNHDKGYLLDLAARGISTVPTHRGGRLDAGGLAAAAEALGARDLVVKPTVGATSFLLFRWDAGHEDAAALEPHRHAFGERAFLAQPFQPAVVDEGEYSATFFRGSFSHAILKTPAAGDFRSQDEFGSHIRRVDAPEFTSWAAEVLEHVEWPTLLARVDAIRGAAGDFLLSELELIEPCLYFRFDPAAPERFAAALRAILDGGTAP